MEDIREVNIKPQQIVAIVDRSGSMGSIAKDAIGGYNAFITEQKKSDLPAQLTLILFDHEYQVVYDKVDLKDVPELTTETFVPRGMTAMNDAIGRAISQFEGEEDVVLAILTDGGENSSKEWTADQIKAKITALEAKDWTVHFLAANQDAFAVGQTYGFQNNINFAATGKGVNDAFSTMSLGASTSRCAYAAKYDIGSIPVKNKQSN